MNTQVTIQHDGRTDWKAPATYTSSCQFHVASFPYDSQVCHLQFGPWNSDAAKVDIVADEFALITKQYISNSEWDLKSASKVKNLRYYPCCKKAYSDVTITINLRRRPLFYQFNLVLPYSILLFCLWIGYLVPPQSAERVSLSIIILLAISIFIQTSSSYLPRSDELSSLSVLYFVVLNEVALSSLVTCLIINMYYTSSLRDRTKMHPWVERVLLPTLETMFSKLGLLSIETYTECSVGGERLTQEDSKMVNDSGECRDVATSYNLTSLDCDHLSVAEQCQAKGHGCIHSAALSHKNHMICSRKNGSSWLCSVESSVCETEKEEIIRSSLLNKFRIEKGNARNQKDDLKLSSILRILKKINMQLRKTVADQTLSNKWKRLAIALDRLFLVLFGLLTLCTLLAFTTIKPSLEDEHMHNFK